MTTTMQVIAIVKPGQRWVFLFDGHYLSLVKLIATACQFAWDDELDFDWTDAKLVIDRAWEMRVGRCN